MVVRSIFTLSILASRRRRSDLEARLAATEVREFLLNTLRSPLDSQGV
jgi:xanthine/CO dehydrogenase XdhC/CoxF family maturation factor